MHIRENDIQKGVGGWDIHTITMRWYNFTQRVLATKATNSITVYNKEDIAT